MAGVIAFGRPAPLDACFVVSLSHLDTVGFPRPRSFAMAGALIFISLRHRRANCNSRGFLFTNFLTIAGRAVVLSMWVNDTGCMLEPSLKQTASERAMCERALTIA